MAEGRPSSIVLHRYRISNFLGCIISRDDMDTVLGVAEAENILVRSLLTLRKTSRIVLHILYQLHHLIKLYIF